ncbi:MAG: MFS transporter [Bacteroidetes bacterium 46-16]|nr:MAG: MFS transporter [Bacteroidetes bacterium 46-16]
MSDCHKLNHRSKTITKIVWILSLVSLFTDMASEMLYPVMPIYLKSIGFCIVLIGILEGFAEAVAGLSKGYFGKLSDNLGRRLPFVQWGYFLSALSKPMMAVLTFPIWIFFARTIDRLGKGIRTGARDAMLSDEASPETKGTVFGFHRSMDTLGAVFGPLLALGFLYFYPGNYKLLFYLAFIPGIIAISFTFFLKDKNPVPKANRIKTSFFDFIQYWKASPMSYRKLVLGLLLFTLFNSSDVFLLLKLKENGLTDVATIGMYTFYNVVYVLFAYPLGIIADRLGLKKIFITGLVLFAIVYVGMALNSHWYIYFGLFFLYGVYAAATEGISKAWISNITDKKDTATAIGAFTGFQSICTMIASSLAGLLWFNFGSMVTFMITAAITLIVIFYMSLLKPA